MDTDSYYTPPPTPTSARISSAVVAAVLSATAVDDEYGAHLQPPTVETV